MYDLIKLTFEKKKKTINLFKPLLSIGIKYLICT